MSDHAPRLYALRGATSVDADTSAAIAARTAELLSAIIERNGVLVDDVVSVIFSATPDLRSDFPAVAARSIGLSHTPLLCCQELAVKDAMARCIRVLMHVYLSRETDVHHVYLHEARQLRLDLPE